MKYSKKKKEKGLVPLTDYISESLFKKPISEFVSKEVSEYTDSLGKTSKDIEKKIQSYSAEVEKKIHQYVEERIASIRSLIESLDNSIAEGLPLLTKKHERHIQNHVVELKKEVSVLERKVSSRMARLELKDRVSPDDLKSHKKEIEVTIRKHKDSISDDINILSKNYQDFGLTKKTQEQRFLDQDRRFVDIDRVLLKMGEDIKKAGEIFEFGYALGVSKGGTFLGNTGFLNFKNGTNTTVAVVANGGGFDITVSATGGGSSGFQKPTGTVDGNNKTFVFASAPRAIVVDNGGVIQSTSSDGTVNWTGTTTVVLSVAPNNDIFAIA